MGLKGLILGKRETIAGTVYGAIVVLSSLAAGSAAFLHDLWRLAATAAVTVLVLWVAHVYAHGLGESLGLGRRLTAAELGAIARREFEIPLAAVAPIGAIVLGALGVLVDRSALWLALALGVATLGAQGVRYARLEGLGPVGTTVAIGVNVALGLVIVALKIAVVH